MKNAALSLVELRKELILISKRKREIIVKIIVSEQIIYSQPALRYLVFMIDKEIH